jgi:hypothetical protein
MWYNPISFPRICLLALLALLPSVARAQDEGIVTDRPDFTEASSTVGQGVIQFESGYTFVYDDADDGTITRSHGAPEMLTRVGLWDDVEVRFGWNYAFERTELNGLVDEVDGFEDLYFGTKIEISDQCGWMPEMATIFQGTAPAGANAFSSGKTTFGINHLYSWELGESGLSLAGSTGFDTDAAVEDDFMVYHQSVSLGIPITEKVGSYFEYFGLYSDQAEVNAPENYFNGGLTYGVTDNLQLDARVGLGLNEQADDLFTGLGASWRF